MQFNIEHNQELCTHTNLKLSFEDYLSMNFIQNYYVSVINHLHFT